MLRAFLIVLLSLPISGAVATPNNHINVGADGIYAELTPETVETAYKMACIFMERVSKFDCSKPVKYSPVALGIPMPDGMWGLYIYGGNAVYISEVFFGPHWDTFAMGVLIHEIVHWRLYWSGAEVTSCQSEEIAWAVFNEYMVVRNRADLVNADWTKSYPSCRAPTQ